MKESKEGGYSIPYILNNKKTLSNRSFPWIISYVRTLKSPPRISPRRLFELSHLHLYFTVLLTLNFQTLLAINLRRFYNFLPHKSVNFAQIWKCTLFSETTLSAEECRYQQFVYIFNRSGAVDFWKFVNIGQKFKNINSSKFRKFVMFKLKNYGWF